jgi:hypothetical protein
MHEHFLGASILYELLTAIFYEESPLFILQLSFKSTFSRKTFFWFTLDLELPKLIISGVSKNFVDITTWILKPHIF